MLDECDVTQASPEWGRKRWLCGYSTVLGLALPDLMHDVRVNLPIAPGGAATAGRDARLTNCRFAMPPLRWNRSKRIHRHDRPRCLRLYLRSRYTRIWEINIWYTR